MEIANQGMLYLGGKSVFEALNDLLKPQQAEVYTPPKPVKVVQIVRVVDPKERHLKRLQFLVCRTKNRRIKQKLSNRIYRLEQAV